MMMREIAGKTYSVRACAACDGTGHKHDATDADKVFVGPFAGRCSHCRNGEILTLMPAREIAESLAHEINDAMSRRALAPVGDMPNWMF